MRDHEALIEPLGRPAGPVRRPAPALLRALGWSAAAVVGGWLATAAFHTPLAEWAGDDGWGVAQLVLSLALGVAALALAFETAIPGSRPRAILLAGLGLGAWLALGVANVVVTGAPTGSLGDGAFCFSFMVAAGAPIMALVVFGLRRTGSLNPGRTLAAAGVSVAALAASLLALCHPFALEIVDFLMHLAAVAVMIPATILLGRRWIDWPTR